MLQSFRYLALAAILPAAGCSTGGRSTASDVQQQALTDYTDCLNHAARKVDDRISDVHTAAVAVSNACRGHARDFEETFYQGMTTEYRDALLQKLSISDSQIRAATDAVMRERANQ
jgi:hypothetical protein